MRPITTCNILIKVFSNSRAKLSYCSELFIGCCFHPTVSLQIKQFTVTKEIVPLTVSGSFVVTFPNERVNYCRVLSFCILSRVFKVQMMESSLIIIIHNTEPVQEEKGFVVLCTNYMHVLCSEYACMCFVQNMHACT